MKKIKNIVNNYCHNGDLTTCLGYRNPDELEKTIGTVLDKVIKDISLEENEAILHHEEGVDLVASNIDLEVIEVGLVSNINREYMLKAYIDEIKNKYDYIIIDCPPSLSMLTINSMTTADTVLVPIQCEYYALEGLSQLIHTVNLVKERLNPDLDMEGVVFTMYDSRTNLSMQVVENVKNHLSQSVYNTVIPRNIRLAEAPSHGMPIHLYDPKSAGAEAYMLLADEVINRKF